MIYHLKKKILGTKVLIYFWKIGLGREELEKCAKKSSQQNVNHKSRYPLSRDI